MLADRAVQCGQNDNNKNKILIIVEYHYYFDRCYNRNMIWDYWKWPCLHQDFHFHSKND